MKKWANTHGSAQRSNMIYSISLKSGSERRPPRMYTYNQQFLEKTTEGRPTDYCLSLTYSVETIERPHSDYTVCVIDDAQDTENCGNEKLTAKLCDFNIPESRSSKKRKLDPVEELINEKIQWPYVFSAGYFPPWNHLTTKLYWSFS